VSLRRPASAPEPLRKREANETSKPSRRSAVRLTASRPGRFDGYFGRKDNIPMMAPATTSNAGLILY
jgi:hypothetical protein